MRLVPVTGSMASAARCELSGLGHEGAGADRWSRRFRAPDTRQPASLLLLVPGADLLRNVDLPTAIAAAGLVLAVVLVIKIGKVLLFAAMLGALAGGVSLGQGSTPQAAGTHAAIGFGVAAATLLLIKLTRNLVLWLLITALGVAALFFFEGFRA